MTGSSTGKCTLLWEKEVTGSGGFGPEKQIETTAQVETLDKYKYIYMVVQFNDEDYGWISYDNIGEPNFIPMQIIKENNTENHGPSSYFAMKYIDDNNFKIIYTPVGGETVKYKIYGIE